MRPFAWTFGMEPFVRWAWVPQRSSRIANYVCYQWLCFYFSRRWDHMTKEDKKWAHK